MSIGKSHEVDETEEFQQKRLADFGATFTDKYANDWEFPRMQYKLILEDLQKGLKNPSPDEKYFMNLMRQNDPPTRRNVNAVIKNEMVRDILCKYTDKSILYLYRGLHDEIDEYLSSDERKLDEIWEEIPQTHRVKNAIG